MTALIERRLRLLRRIVIAYIVLTFVVTSYWLSLSSEAASYFLVLMLMAALPTSYLFSIAWVAMSDLWKPIFALVGTHTQAVDRLLLWLVMAAASWVQWVVLPSMVARAYSRRAKAISDAAHHLR